MKTLSRLKLVPLAVLPGLLAAGCGTNQSPAPQAQFKVEVAPLTLPGITNACYRITVTNGPDRQGEVVWQEDSVCADDFGDGKGAITYVGPCDADVTDANPTPMNSVTIELLDLYSGSPTSVAIDDDEYVNPCGHIIDWAVDRDDVTGEDPEDQNGPCTINKVCQENADVLVEFNLTIMRDANQGFFDIAVNFADIFCSAKLDCKDAFLHDAQGDRNATVIVAFACTSGENEETYLYGSNLLLSCANGDTLIPATTVAGQAGPIDDGVFQSATYIGDEQLTSNGQPLEKCYWNRAIGLDLAELQGPCTLTGFATAGSTELTQAMLIGEGAAYPIITWSVEVIDVNGGLCQENQLNADQSGVTTAYLDANTTGAQDIVAALLPSSATDLPRQVGTGGQGTVYACGPRSVECKTVSPASPMPAQQASAELTIVATEGADAITVSVGAATTTIPLTDSLAGFSLGARCYEDRCCSGLVGPDTQR